MKKGLSPAKIALVAVLISLTTVLTKVVQIPIPASQGYWHLGDAAIAFAGLVFGPWVGLAAGGIGTALADLLSGPYAVWAPISLVAHGVQGFLLGMSARKIASLIILLAGRTDGAPERNIFTGGFASVLGMIVAFVIGAAAMVLGYLLGGALLKGWPAAVAEVPFNAIQAAVGGVVGIPLVIAVRKAYPPIDRIGQRGRWTEE